MHNQTWKNNPNRKQRRNYDMNNKNNVPNNNNNS